MSPLQTVPLQGIRALLVEDDAAIRDVLAQMLADEGMVITALHNGQEALAHLKVSAPPDVILLDLMMPVMDGWQFRVEQKRDPMLAGIPVVAMSADGSAKAEAIDADAYVRKPVDFDSLLGRIEAVIQGARRQRLAVANRLAALGTLASGIAHEVNNPLTYIMANLQYLVDRLPSLVGDEAKDVSEILIETLDGTRRIARIVNQAQLVAPASTGDPDAVVDLRAALEAALDRLQGQIQRRAGLATNIDGRPTVRGDRSRLEQLFTNLLLNAMQSIAEGRASENQISVTLRTLPNVRAVIEIADTGAGIPVELHDRIFQPFFTTKPVGQGAGLGLAICRGIVSALGGELTFDSELGRGSAFRVVLPLVAGEVAAPTTTARLPATRRLPAGSRVLVIDDEPMMARASRYILGPDYDVSFAKGAAAGLALLEKDAGFELLLCELMMEETNGSELAAQIEARHPPLSHRLIFMSGGALTPQAQAFIDSKRYPCVSKPFDRDQLGAAMAACGVPSPPIIRGRPRTPTGSGPALA